MVSDGWGLQLRTFAVDGKHCRPEPAEGDIPIIRGRYLTQYAFDDTAQDLWVSEDYMRYLSGEEWGRYRLAVRGVTQGLNERTVIASILPPCTATNASVHVSISPVDIDDLLVLCSLMNSYVSDWQARRLVQISAPPYVFQQIRLPIPSPSLRKLLIRGTLRLLSRSARFIPLAKSMGVAPIENDLEAGKERLMLEAYAASAFQLSLDEYWCILQDFPLSCEGFRWSAFSLYEEMH